jgi:KipI family sensor histidine kinase inhibitor
MVLGDSVDRETHRQVTELAGRIQAARIPGIIELVPAYAALTVFFEGEGEAVRRSLAAVAEAGSLRGAGGAAPTGALHTIPVTYAGPDLDDVALATGLSIAEVIRRHSSREYVVYLLGFAPGFAYLGDLDPSLVLPRRPAPRTRVPAGSVAIAGSQTGVYPLTTPGGWHLIGSTTTRMFDPAREPAALLRAGDRVRFEPIR